MAMQIMIGPILGFRGLKAGRWGTSALVVTKGVGLPPSLTYSLGDVPQTDAETVLLKTFGGCQVWRLEWWVRQTDEEQLVDYFLLPGITYRYVVPARHKPLRLGYGSCFDLHSRKDLNKVLDKDAMWKVLETIHLKKPYHILFMGGDQVYADLLWETILPLRNWLSLPLLNRLSAPFTEEMQQLVAAFYFDLYCRKWSQKVPAALMSQIPTLMMWDDHDIFDGWGSYAPELQECPVFKGVYQQAREHFRLFQLQAGNDTDLGEAFLWSPRSYTYAYRIGEVALVALDLRSERTQNQVMSLETWNRVQEWIKELPEKKKPGSFEQQACRHLLIMASIPVVNINLSLMETTLDLLPGQQPMEDDLLDQWLSRTHQEERLRLIHRLLKFSKQSGCRVSIVSGDAHTASMGYIQSERNRLIYDEANVINQFTSSAMVNIPPSALIVYLMEKMLGNQAEQVDRGITARLVKFPGTSRRIIAARNWLSLTLDAQHRLWAQWYVEGEDTPYTKVVHPIGAITT